MRHTTRAMDVMSHVHLTVAPDTTVAQAWELMRETDIRQLPVVVAGRCVGMVTELRLIDAAAPGVPKDCELQVSTIAGHPPLGVLPGDELQLVLELISVNDGGFLVVADTTGSLLGMVTSYDAIAAAARMLRRIGRSDDVEDDLST